MLPDHFPPHQTTYRWFTGFRDDIQDRDSAIPLLRASRAWYPFIERVFADSAYVAERVANATRIIIEIVRKPPGQIGFAMHPRRWVVERFLAWLGRNSHSS